MPGPDWYEFFLEYPIPVSARYKNKKTSLAQVWIGPNDRAQLWKKLFKILNQFLAIKITQMLIYPSP
jgi:hypothetical protein